MNHLNFCRQMVKQFTDRLKIPSVQPEMKAFMSHCIDLACASQKFILPDGGRIYDDPDFRALDETIPLCLPYPLIAIEFVRSPEFIGSRPNRVGANQPSKALMFARQREDEITITMAVWSQPAGAWAPYPEVSMPRVGYIDRARREGGYVGIKVAQGPSPFRVPIPVADYSDEVSALLCMLNVLNCKNVHIDHSPVSKTRQAMHKKGALPFDSYHILTIDAPCHTQISGAATGGHRSPREHLRRGHIRRLQDSRRIWVNAAVINAGVGGRISKEYRVMA